MHMPPPPTALKASFVSAFLLLSLVSFEDYLRLAKGRDSLFNGVLLPGVPGTTGLPLMSTE